MTKHYLQVLEQLINYLLEKTDPDNMLHAGKKNKKTP
jgi:hypothetical protein